MAKIIYIEDSGARREIEVAEGLSVMEGAVKNMVPGIDADCGGACACGTCQVYIDAAWLDRLPPREAMENDMIEFANDVKPNSRLSCQLKVTAALDGLIVTTPPQQH